jgi:hypothetical protein
MHDAQLSARRRRNGSLDGLSTWGIYVIFEIESIQEAMRYILRTLCCSSVALVISLSIFSTLRFIVLFYRRSCSYEINLH